MKKINSLSLLETTKRNKYFYDSRTKRTQLCHPLLFHMLRINANGGDVKAWVESLDNIPVEIDGCGSFSKKEVLYYYQKYLILKKNGHITTIDQSEILAGTIRPEEIKRQLANTQQVTFEVTDNCNLDCRYCGYGEFYNDYDRRENKQLDISAALQLLKYLSESWNSPLNHSLDRSIFISFYGGEPLLNFPFVKAVVRAVEQLDAPRNRFIFGMTTNALLIDKYMDFLAGKQFSLLISLDGNEQNNAYRRFKNGKPAYQKILDNVKALREKHPDYFRRRVNFNAVLHNKNSVAGIHRYFKENFNKRPNISELNTTGIKESQKKEFRETYANIYENLQQSEDYRPVEEDMFIKLPGANAAMKFLHTYCDFCFKDYNGLLYFDSQAQRPPTGTCPPFSKKIFLTVNGKLLPCERIGHQFGLGTVTAEGVELDFDQIAAKYNAYLDKLRPLCNQCFNSKTCKQCIFNLDTIDEDKPLCYGFMSDERYARDLSASLSYLEAHPEVYSKMLRKVTIE